VAQEGQELDLVAQEKDLEDQETDLEDQDQEGKDLEDQDQEGKDLKGQVDQDLEWEEEKDLGVPQAEKEERQGHQLDVHPLSQINLMLLLGKRNISANSL